MKAPPARSLLAALLLLAACQSEGGMVASPLVRVDLRDKLPPAVQRRVAVADTSYECRKPFALEAGGARQAFVAGWRVLDEGTTLFVTAVEVLPEGPTSGAGSPSATAVVEELRALKQESRSIGVAPVRVTWSASKGCSKLGAATRLELRADDPGCKKPKGPGKLLTPVK